MVITTPPIIKPLNVIQKKFRIPIIICIILIVNSFIRLLFLQQLVFIEHPIEYFVRIVHHMYLLFDGLVIVYHWHNLERKEAASKTYLIKQVHMLQLPNFDAIFTNHMVKGQTDAHFMRDRACC